MLSKLKENRGDGYINVLLLVLVSVLLVSLSINIFSIYMNKYNLDIFANELCREAQISGKIGNEVNDKIIKLKSQTGLDPVIRWDTSYFNALNKTVQLNTTINLTLSQTVKLGGFGGLPGINIILTNKSSGRSEVYWK